MTRLHRNNLFLLAVLVCLPAKTLAASADIEALESLLNERYFEVEFFVFERPDVLDFASEEILTLDRPRSLPRSMRTQRLAPEALWTDPLDTMTRACLTFPTLSYELLPPLDADPATDGVLESADSTSVEQAGDSTLLDESFSHSEPLPLPQISPVLEPDPQLDFLARMAEFERSLQADSERWQAPEQFRLQRAANRIEQRGLGRILFHGRWLQAVPPREAADPVLVVGGEQLNRSLPNQELIGSVGVTLGRYLHFKADLFFHGPGLGLEPAVAGMNGTGEAVLLVPERVSELDGALDGTLDRVGAGYMQLSESRRMRSEELHYLDHPKLGLVVRIDPVSFPEDLVESFEALEALEESTD